MPEPLTATCGLRQHRVLPRADDGLLASYGVSDRVAIEHGDARPAVPSGSAYRLSTVLRCLGDADVIAVLHAIRAVAVADARLLVMEMPLPDGPPGHPQAATDMTA